MIHALSRPSWNIRPVTNIQIYRRETQGGEYSVGFDITVTVRSESKAPQAIHRILHAECRFHGDLTRQAEIKLALPLYEFGPLESKAIEIKVTVGIPYTPLYDPARFRGVQCKFRLEDTTGREIVVPEFTCPL